MKRACKNVYTQRDNNKCEPACRLGWFHVTKIFNFKHMNKFVQIILIGIIVIGCDGISDSIIDPSTADILVTNISAPTELEFSSPDIEVNTSITFSSSETIEKVWFRLTSQDGSTVITSFTEMEKNQNVYSGSFKMTEQDPNGIYTIEYFIQTNIQEEKKMASHNFSFENMQNNVPPVISNLNMPDQIDRDIVFKFSVDVEDENGYEDVKDVFYQLFRPNGEQVSNSQGISEFPLFDDGNTEVNGDEVAFDGIYTVLLVFPSSAAETGTWKFEFNARDRNDELSNTITHNLVVQ